MAQLTDLMKTLLKHGLLIAGSGIWVAAATAAPMRDAATHEQLAAKLRGVQQADPMLKLEPAKGQDPTKENRIPDLLSQSDFLCFGGRATLVPKRAILHVPENLAERLKMQVGTPIQSWADFFAANRGWIATMEVTRAQAEGREAFDEDTTKRLQDSVQVVVATFQAGPISVLPPKVEAPATTDAEKAKPADPAKPVAPAPSKP
jgi:hypothetical protein